MTRMNALYSDAAVTQYDPNLCDPKTTDKNELNNSKLITEMNVKNFLFSNNKN